jgi:hypothetical protein
MKYGNKEALQDILFVIFQTCINFTIRFGKHWKHVITTITAIVAITRIGIWIAKAVASAGTVDTALNLIGLGEYVRPFEDMVDSAIGWVMSWIMEMIG